MDRSDGAVLHARRPIGPRARIVDVDGGMAASVRRRDACRLRPHGRQGTRLLRLGRPLSEGPSDRLGRTDGAARHELGRTRVGAAPQVCYYLTVDRSGEEVAGMRVGMCASGVGAESAGAFVQASAVAAERAGFAT